MYTAAIHAGTKQVEAAQAFLRYLTNPRPPVALDRRRHGAGFGHTVRPHESGDPGAKLRSFLFLDSRPLTRE